MSSVDQILTHELPKNQTTKVVIHLCMQFLLLSSYNYKSMHAGQLQADSWAGTWQVRGRQADKLLADNSIGT